MFQTDIHHFLQSFANEGLTTFMQFITSLGYLEFFMLLLVFILFAIDFKKGFILLLVLLWTGAFTFFFKEYFALPRPFHVDNSIQFLDGALPDSTHFSFHQQDAPSFFAELPPEVVAETRKQHLENGFPSGHTSMAVTLWGMMALLFRKRWLTVLCVSLIILIPFSRLYLGVHFLADVLGGYVLGFGLLFLLYKTIMRPDTLNVYLTTPRLSKDWNILSIFLILSPLLMFLLVKEEVWILPAYAFGFGLGFYLLGRQGFPEDYDTISYRLACFLVTGGLLVGVKVLLKSITLSLNLGIDTWTDFIRYFLEGLVLIWVATTLCIRFGWMHRKEKTVS